MPLPRETLARALSVIRAIARPQEDVLLVTNPWAALKQAGLPEDAVSELMHVGCLIGLGRLSFRIERNNLPQEDGADTPTPARAELRPCVLLVVDVENALHAHAAAGVPFDPARIRAAANRVGPVGFAFGYANLAAVPSRDLAALALAGFHCIHCERLPDTNNGKDTTDELLRDIVHRFLDHAAVEAVVLVSDDRDFASILTAARDRGVRGVVLSFRDRPTLGKLAEHRTIALPQPRKVSAAPPSQPTTRRWNPEDMADDLHLLDTTMASAEQDTLMARIRMNAPLPQRFLRVLIRRYLGGIGRNPLSFKSIVALADDAVLPEDRGDIEQEALLAFCSSLVAHGILTQKRVGEGEKERKRYEPNWTHPFVARAIADFTPEQEGKNRRSASAVLRRAMAANPPMAPQQPHATASADESPPALE